MIQAPALFNCYGGASDPYCYHSGPLIMSLKEIIEPLLRDGGEPMSRYTRAAKLFEFQISLFYQKSFEHLIAGKEDSKLTRATLRVGIRFSRKPKMIWSGKTYFQSKALRRTKIINAFSMICLSPMAAGAKYSIRCRWVNSIRISRRVAN